MGGVGAGGKAATASSEIVYNTIRAISAPLQESERQACRQFSHTLAGSDPGFQPACPMSHALLNGP